MVATGKPTKLRSILFGMVGFIALAMAGCSSASGSALPEAVDNVALAVPTATPPWLATRMAQAAQEVAAQTAVAQTAVARTAVAEPAAEVSAPGAAEAAIQAPEPTPAPVPEAPEISTYEVQPGDTLLGLAMTFGVPMAAIQQENQMGSGTIIQLGEVLQIPASVSWAGASPFWVVHEIATGETLGAVAARYGLSVDELVTTNNLADPDSLSVGQALVLPLNALVEAVVVEEPVAAAAAPLPTEAPEAPVVAEAPVEAEPEPAQAAAADEAPLAAPAEPVAPPADVAELPAEIFRLLNEQRAAYGLPPLAWNAILAQAAQRHADDCYARGYCGHTGSDGSTYRERIIREGYDPVRWSECWAWYGSAEKAVAMWMDEVPPNDAHRRTILSTYLTEVGVGVVPGNGFGYYFIADFGTPR